VKYFLMLLTVMLFVVIFGGWASAQAQDVTPPDGTPEPTALATVDVTQPPVVVVENPAPATEAPFSWRDGIFGVLFLVMTIFLGFSHPPSAGKLWKDLIEQVQQKAAETPTMLDDALVEAVNSKIQPRLDALDAAIASAISTPAPSSSIIKPPKLE
jgi:hypothetical protein